MAGLAPPWGQVELVGEPDLAGAAEEQRPQRPSVGGDDAEGDERVHAGARVAGAAQGHAVERPGTPGDDGRGEGEGHPLPAVELERRHHGHGDHRDGEHGDDGQTSPEGTEVVVAVVVPVPYGRAMVAGVLVIVLVIGAVVALAVWAGNR